MKFSRPCFSFPRSKFILLLTALLFPTTFALAGDAASKEGATAAKPAAPVVKGSNPVPTPDEDGEILDEELADEDLSAEELEEFGDEAIEGEENLDDYSEDPADMGETAKPAGKPAAAPAKK